MKKKRNSGPPLVLTADEAEAYRLLQEYKAKLEQRKSDLNAGFKIKQCEKSMRGILLNAKLRQYK